ncbi:MAG: YraN family protein [Gammaproteobacteria bacterium]|jgi:putative endonuclease
MSRRAESSGLGEAWELRAADFLVGQGMTIITRRYRCRLGELDIVASDRGQLVIVEVKARAHAGRALATVGHAKRRRIISATRHFLMCHSEWHPRPIRFDVIAFEGIDSSRPGIHWVRNAFDSA